MDDKYNDYILTHIKPTHSHILTHTDKHTPIGALHDPVGEIGHGVLIAYTISKITHPLISNTCKGEVP